MSHKCFIYLKEKFYLFNLILNHMVDLKVIFIHMVKALSNEETASDDAF